VIQLKSAFEPSRPGDGYRILIDPEWPRGMPKGKSAGVDWMKVLYPSHNLQGWMKRNPRKRDGFRDRYLLELASKDAAIDKLRGMYQERGTITIVTVPDDTWGIYETLQRYLSATCE
jgi:uncharacterized protein YeaO (DUF488 family)